MRTDVVRMTRLALPGILAAVRLALLAFSLLASGCGRFGFAELIEPRTADGPSPGEAGTTLADGGSPPHPGRDGGAGSTPDEAGGSGGSGGSPDAGGGVDGAVDAVTVSDVATAKIASGLDHNCFVHANGVAACWGFDGNGERGDGPGATGSQSVPTAVVQQSSGPLSGVDTGFIHGCGLSTTGAAWCWGGNSYGQLGQPGNRSSAAPVAVGGGLSFGALSVGAYHGCAIDTTGGAWCWGRGSGGRLGNRSAQDQSQPGPVAGSLKFDAVSSGSAHSCAVEQGTHFVFCWGAGGSGRLGTGDTSQQDVPVRVTSNLTFRSVDAGTDFTCGLTLDDRALCWGTGSEGQLGNGTRSGALTPVAVTGGLRFRMLAVSGEISGGFAPSPHACALTPAGTAYCWGSNTYGQLGAGDASLMRSTAPIAVDQSASGPFVSIAAGFGFTCAIDTRDAAWCWGFDGTGELGVGSGRQDSQAPLRVMLP